jgi:hypothetical protein
MNTKTLAMSSRILNSGGALRDYISRQKSDANPPFWLLSYSGRLGGDEESRGDGQRGGDAQCKHQKELEVAAKAAAKARRAGGEGRAGVSLSPRKDTLDRPSTCRCA